MRIQFLDIPVPGVHAVDSDAAFEDSLDEVRYEPVEGKAEGGFARLVRAHDDDQLALLNLQMYVSKGIIRGGTIAEVQRFYLDNGQFCIREVCLSDARLNQQTSDHQNDNERRNT